MATLSFAAARQTVLDRVSVPDSIPAEIVWLPDALGRVLAHDIPSDRDMPPLARSLRDGYAVRAEDIGESLEVIGEIRAGQMPSKPVAKGQTLSIMTGAVLPDGATQILMKEHVDRSGDTICTEKAPNPGEWISPAGSMARRNDTVLPKGLRIDSSAIAMLAAIGRSQVEVTRRPVVRILSTGDEIVDIARMPNATEVRNSNSWALAADVHRFGGRAEILPIAPDREQETRDLIQYGLDADLLLISGGVSAGDYDFVEVALANLHAEFYFDRVSIQPGQPTVFGRARGRYFFGLPGNPLSTLVTFRIFAAAALERLCGIALPALTTHRAPLTKAYRHKPGMTRFLPGYLSQDEVEMLAWQGSGDIPALVRANCFIVVDSERETWEAGDSIEILPK